MSLKALSEYTVYSKYARYLSDKKRRETWDEMVDRVFDMHAEKYVDALTKYPEFREDFEFAKRQVKKKRVLGAQRLLQFGGAPIFKHNAKVYNCAYGYIDRPAAFNEAFYLLLCGCGVGFSVQRKHAAKLPLLSSPTKEDKIFTPRDSIEGWADCVAALLSSYFKTDQVFPEYAGHRVVFDYSKIRPEGALIAGQFKAPGPKMLADSMEKVRAILDRRLLSGQNIQLRPIDVYDILMHVSNAVLSGGVRRSATICLFSKDDKEMLTAKTGNWYEENPQRSRSNNSVLLVKDQLTREEFAEIIKSTREFGEPGFVFSESEDVGFNPCVEIGMYPQINGRSGWQFCNLTEGNGRYCDTKEKFLEVCRALAIVGTMQAGYTDFCYVSEETRLITEREALLGCSITGIMDNPAILLDPDIQRAGAQEIRKMNEKIAKFIGINPAARTTCVKPAGTTSLVLGTASGVHPHHAKRYIRNIQANALEFPAQKYREVNPIAVEKSSWGANDTDLVVSFLCEVPSGAITKNNFSAVDLLEKVKSTQQNWVEAGTAKSRCAIPELRHNVSNTITVKPEEWPEVEAYIYKNRKWFSGISLLSSSGDLDYKQSPNTTILNAEEISRTYGDAAILASGLIVDGLRAFNNDLWDACSGVLMHGDNFQKPEEADKKEWVRRAKKFATNYFDGDLKKMTYCLKHVQLWKRWLDIKRTHVPIDWSAVIEDHETLVDASTLGAQACAGGACELRPS